VSLTNRVPRTLGGLCAVAILAVAPSLATGDPAPTARMAGSGGGGGNGGCNDNSPPSSQWGNGWWNRDNQGSYWNGWGDGNGSFDGQAHDSGCGGSSSSAATAARAGKVDHVMVAVDRVNGSRCQRMYSTGRLGAAGSCGSKSTHWMRAKGAAAWRFDIPKKLPQGQYQLHRMAVDASGNRERQHRMRLSIR
jgi:hypothetical protein